MKRTSWLTGLFILFTTLTNYSQASTENYSQAYYLQQGKVYQYDIASKKAILLDMTPYPIVEFWLSPNQDYIAFKELTFQKDCVEFSALGIYDLAEKEKIAELGNEGYNQIGFFEWIEDNRLMFILDVFPQPEFWKATSIEEVVNRYNELGEEDIQTASYEYIIGGGVRLNESEIFEDDMDYTESESGNEKYVLICMNEGIQVETVEGEELTLLTVKDGDIIAYTIWAWLNEDAFYYTAQHNYAGQCDPVIEDLYLYNIRSKKNTLIAKNTNYMQLLGN